MESANLSTWCAKWSTGEQMAKCVLTLKVRVAWWVRWYISACQLFAQLHQVQPDADKIAAFVVRHGVKVDVNHA